jgi:hypothetical protein
MSMLSVQSHVAGNASMALRRCAHLSGGELLATALLLSNLCICFLLRCLRLPLRGLRLSLHHMATNLTWLCKQGLGLGPTPRFKVCDAVTTGRSMCQDGRQVLPLTHSTQSKLLVCSPQLGTVVIQGFLCRLCCGLGCHSRLATHLPSTARFASSQCEVCESR